jgi:hypothetical protein
MLRDADKLADAGSGRLIVDLNQPGALDAAAQWKNRTGGSVTGFTAHTNSDTIARAKSLGVDRILTRSAFVQQLPELLKNESSDHGDETNS